MTTMPEFLEALSDDLRLTASAQTPILEKLVSQLREHPGFISGPALRERISTLWPDEANSELVAALWRLILGLHEVVNENGFDREQRNQLFDAVSETAVKKGDEDAARLKEILRTLAGPFPAIRRQAKAIRIVKASGHQLSEFRFVCDLRPVFTPENREHVDGLIPLTTLTMETVNASGDSQRNEVVLSYCELQDLINEAEVAKRKLDQLVEIAGNAKIVVPEMAMTRRPTEGDNRE